MTQREAIGVARALRDTPITDDILARFLAELEGRVAIELRGEADWQDAGQLEIPHPYEQVYWCYLIAMLDLVEGRSDMYKLSYPLFCRAYDAYAGYCRRSGGDT